MVSIMLSTKNLVASSSAVVRLALTLALVRCEKGQTGLGVCDDDNVSFSDLSRQLFDTSDIGKNKAIRLARRLSREGFFPTVIQAYPYRFQEIVEMGIEISDFDYLVCAVDNNRSRVDTSLFGLEHDIPVIHAAVSRDGNSLYCAVQETKKACFGCIFPQSINDDAYPCNLPGIIDVIQVVAGLVVFAIDSLICGRHREWNLRSISLDGSLPDSAKTIARNPDCPLCGPSHSGE